MLVLPFAVEVCGVRARVLSLNTAGEEDFRDEEVAMVEGEKLEEPNEEFDSRELTFAQLGRCRPNISRAGYTPHPAGLMVDQQDHNREQDSHRYCDIVKERYAR
ncbi:hypothetical protein EVAR_65667_1 [Eumeta japonica]|uniref:Uncharacterized protein n=1 Tax=Eumeta variegata TaxID=151549 RepID=A0A4C2A017_EUMVA|nr:hypothetical protein EVAR_65667_1 [Eumeta japonica]